MRINVETTNQGKNALKEGEIYLDRDGDLHIVIAAIDVSGIKDDELLVCCIRDDAAWIRGRAGAVDLDRVTRLSAGDSVTMIVE